MKEYKLLMIDNVPDGLNPYLVSDFPPPVTTGGFKNLTSIFTYKGKKYYGSGASGMADAYFAAAYQAFGLDVSKRLIMGARVYASNPTYFSPLIFLNAQGNTGLGVSNAASIGMLANTEYYMETELDIANMQLKVYLDSFLKSTTALTPAQIAAIPTTYFNLYFGGTSSVNIFWYMRDVYFAHCSGSDDVQRLGPIVTSVAQIDSLTANGGWGKAVGQADSDYLALPTDKFGSMYAPRFENDSSVGSISQRLKMPANIPSNSIIKGVQFAVSGQDRGTNPKNIVATVNQGGQQIALPNKQLSVTPIMGRNLGPMQMAAPDGGVWTPEKLNATDFSLSLA